MSAVSEEPGLLMGMDLFASTASPRSAGVKGDLLIIYLETDQTSDCRNHVLSVGCAKKSVLCRKKEGRQNTSADEVLHAKSTANALWRCKLFVWMNQGRIKLYVNSYPSPKCNDIILNTLGCKCFD